MIFFASFNISMYTTYAMEISIEANENRDFGTEVYSSLRYLAYVRIWDMSDICQTYLLLVCQPECLTYDTIRIPDGRPAAIMMVQDRTAAA
jgi:hypothetical protein